MDQKTGNRKANRVLPWMVVMAVLLALSAPLGRARADSTPVISSSSLPGPYTIDQLQGFEITAQNPADGTEYSSVLFTYTVSNIQLADITVFDYFEPLDSTWYPVPRIQDGSNVTGTFGPESGFPLPVPYDMTSQFRIQIARGGSYPVVVNLVDLNNGSALLASLSATAVVNFNPPVVSFGQAVYAVRTGDQTVINVTSVNTSYLGMSESILADALVTLTPPAGSDLGGLQIDGFVLVGVDWVSIGSITLAPGQTQFWLSSFPLTPYHPPMVGDSGITYQYRFEFTAPTSLTGITTVQAEVIGDDDFVEPYYLASDPANTLVNVLDMPILAFSQLAYAVRPGDTANLLVTAVHADYTGMPASILGDARVTLTPPAGVNLGGLQISGSVLVGADWISIGSITLSSGQTQFWLSSFPQTPYRPPLVGDSGATYQYRFTFIAPASMIGITTVQAQVIGDDDFTLPYYLTSNLASAQVNVLSAPSMSFGQASYSFAPGELATITATAVNPIYLGMPESILADARVTLTPPAGVDFGGLEISGAVYSGGNWVSIGSIILTTGQTQFWLSSFPLAPYRPPMVGDSGITYQYRFQFTPTPAMAGFTWVEAQIIGDDDFTEPYYLTSNLAASQVNILATPAVELNLPAFTNYNALVSAGVDIQHANYSGMPVNILGDVHFQLTTDLSLDGTMISAYRVVGGNEIPYGSYTLSGGITAFWLSNFGHARTPLVNDSNLHLEYRLKFNPAGLVGHSLTLESQVVGALAGNFDNPTSWYIHSNLASAATYINAQPTGLNLDNLQVKEHGPAGTLVGHLSAVDDISPPYTYSLITATGCDGSSNTAFAIDDDQLVTGRRFSWESGDQSLPVCIQVADGGGLTYHASFTIQVINLPEILLPMVMNEPPQLRNGDFSAGFDYWITGRGWFNGHGSGFAPQLTTWVHNPAVVIGSPAYQNGAIPVGYGFITQQFAVTQRYLTFEYELHTYDIFKGSSSYYDTFELSINQMPAAVTGADREARCTSSSLNPVGSTPVVAPSAPGLVFCAGGTLPMPNPPLERIFPSGVSRTVVIDLQAYQNQVISIYLSLWSREYDSPYWSDQAYYNSWVYMTGFNLTDILP